MFSASPIAALAAAALLLSACTSNDNGGAALEGVPPAMAAAEAEGTIPAYCPQVSLREGTAILRKGEGESLQYVASIVSTSRDCRIVNGELRMKIGVAGRVVPGPAATPGEIGLPIRIAVVRGVDVLYSQQGSRAVTLRPGEGAEQFVYVDQAVAVPDPTARSLVVYAGFDEGPQS